MNITYKTILVLYIMESDTWISNDISNNDISNNDISNNDISNNDISNNDISNNPFEIYQSPEVINYSTYTKILFIDSIVENTNPLFSSYVKDDTYPLVYKYYTDRASIFEFLKNFTNITRIAFVFHGPSNLDTRTIKVKSFLQNGMFFTNNDIIDGQTIFSDNVLFVKELIELYSLTNIDYLGCNTVLYTEWQLYYNLLQKINSQIVIGASDDNTGNMKQMGDWIMENTAENIKTIYFNDTIENYNLVLSTTTTTYTAASTDISFTSDTAATIYLIGGGGAGGTGRINGSANALGGNGGNGGQVISHSYTFISGKNYKVIVGSGASTGVARGESTLLKNITDNVIIYEAIGGLTGNNGIYSSSQNSVNNTESNSALGGQCKYSYDTNTFNGSNGSEVLDGFIGGGGGAGCRASTTDDNGFNGNGIHGGGHGGTGANATTSGSRNGTNGTPNTGGGGGGGGGNGGSFPTGYGGNGGSGIAYIVVTSSPPQSFMNTPVFENRNILQFFGNIITSHETSADTIAESQLNKGKSLPLTGSDYINYSIDDGTGYHHWYTQVVSAISSSAYTLYYIDNGTNHYLVANINNANCHTTTDINNATILEIKQTVTHGYDYFFIKENNYQFADLDELKIAVNLWTGDANDKSSALSTYGEINTWDTSLVTSMFELFMFKSTFNDDISSWNVSNVISMGWMFKSASAFNKPLNIWDVSNVTTMDYMFYASAFNKPLDDWIVSSVNNMQGMFAHAVNFNQDISGWNISNVTNISYMFYGAIIFNQDIRVWSVANNTNLSSMFTNTDTMTTTYHPTTGTNPDPDYGDTPGIGFFNYVTDYPFDDLDELKIAVNLWTGDTNDHSSALSTYGEINTWDTSSVTSMYQLFFAKTTFNDDISNWNVSNVTRMDHMFHSALVFNQDIRDWDVLNVTNTYRMFMNAIAFNQDIRVWSLNATNRTEMFHNTPAMAAIYGPTGTNPDPDYVNTPGIGFFNYIPPYPFADLDELKIAVNLWTGDTNDHSSALTTYGEINNWDTSSVISMNRLFQNKRNLQR